MIDKRLIGMMGDSKRYIAKNVALQWLALAANVAMIFAVSRYLGALYDQLTIGDTMAGAPNLPLTLGIVAAALLVRMRVFVKPDPQKMWVHRATENNQAK